MVGIDEWRKYVKENGLKFKFEGLGSSRRDFFSTVGDACVADERFMDDYMSTEFDSQEEGFDAALAAEVDTDEYLSRFAEYLVNRVCVAKWPKSMPHERWTDRQLVTLAHMFIDKKDDYIRDWVVGDADQYWDMLREPGEMVYLLKEHPPVEVLSHASDSGIPLKDVFFVCPSCRGEPQTEADLIDMYGEKNGYPVYYCGSCGGSMNVNRLENIIDFFNALNVVPYPFNDEKRAAWEKLKAERKALGENKLDIKVGDLVHLEASEIKVSGADHWVNYKHEPGELVTCTGISEKSMSYDYADGSGHGGITWDHVWSRQQEKPC